MKFEYWDNSKKHPLKLFDVEAENILEADKKFKEATGIDSVKTPTIGVRITPNARDMTRIMDRWASVLDEPLKK